MITSLVDLLGRTGPAGREVGVRLDLLRALGPAHAWRRLRWEHAATRIGDFRPTLYAEIWAGAAGELGAEVVDLSAGFLEIRREGVSTRVWHHVVPLDDAVTLRTALEKALVYRMLRAEGIPIPDHLEFDAADLTEALRFLRAGDLPCVVKPAGGTSGGSGTTSGLRTRSELVRARLRASRVASRLLIERQASGAVYRLLFLDGKLLDVLRRLPPRVTGDGHSTIGQLIEAENRRRVAAQGRDGPMLLSFDLECVLTLERAGLGLDSVLSASVTIPVKSVTNQNGAADNATIRDGVAEALVEEARAAARLVGVRLAGVDVVTPDVSKSLVESGGVVIEVNGTPGLHYHYQVIDSERATRVAVPILQALLAGRTR